jgi:transposase-like protein
VEERRAAALALKLIYEAESATDLRKILYTTNFIESLNAQVRKAVGVRGHFPSERLPPSSSG